MILPKKRFITASLTALIICMSAFFMPVYASTGDDGGEYGDYVPILAISSEFDEPIAINESMLVNAAWLDAEMLRIDVTDLNTGAVSSLAIRLGDFIADAGNSPYILIQAADLDGNLSGIIRIANPFYIPADDTEESADENDETTGPGDMAYGEPTAPPFSGLTPDGTGTVVDNVVTQNDIEFFTVYTEEGNVFFLVVDRKSSNENVHLLNAVTEADLMALAERSGNPIDSSVSAIPPIEDLLPADGDNQSPSTTPEPEPDPEPEPRGNNNNLIIIGVAALVFGAAAYYFKIVRPKQNAVYDDDDYGEPDNDDAEEDYGGDILEDDYNTEDGGDKV